MTNPLVERFCACFPTACNCQPELCRDGDDKTMTKTTKTKRTRCMHLEPIGSCPDAHCRALYGTGNSSLRTDGADPLDAAAARAAMVQRNNSAVRSNAESAPSVRTDAKDVPNPAAARDAMIAKNLGAWRGAA
jgi:hypothetical protein